MKRSPMKPRTTPMKRTVSVKKVNRQRRSREFVRCFGSPERVEWVKAQPCLVAGCPRPAENAHVVSDGEHGMGRKAGYRCVAPLCRSHHRLGPNALHTIGSRDFEKIHHLSLAACAERTDAAWRERQEAA